jgi:hypothetical protein
MIFNTMPRVYFCNSFPWDANVNILKYASFGRYLGHAALEGALHAAAAVLHHP